MLQTLSLQTQLSALSWVKRHRRMLMACLIAYTLFGLLTFAKKGEDEMEVYCMSSLLY